MWDHAQRQTCLNYLTMLRVIKQRARNILQQNHKTDRNFISFPQEQMTSKGVDQQDQQPLWILACFLNHPALLTTKGIEINCPLSPHGFS